MLYSASYLKLLEIEETNLGGLWLSRSNWFHKVEFIQLGSNLIESPF